MRNTSLKTLGRFSVRFGIPFVALVTGVCFWPSRGHKPAGLVPDTTALAQDEGCPGNNGTPHPCDMISCGDYMCPCPPAPSECYFAWQWDQCYNF